MVVASYLRKQLEIAPRSIMARTLDEVAHKIRSGTLYIRRRSQLLREKANDDVDPAAKRDYLRIRSALLAQRYGVHPMSEVSSIRSRSQSIRSMSRNATMENEFVANQLRLEVPSQGVVPTVSAEASSDTLTDVAKLLKQVKLRVTSRIGGESKHNSSLIQDVQCLSNEKAQASRAMAGDTTLGENYAFAGMHHIFDQHKAAVNSVKFATDDKSRLACCSMDGKISICQLIPPPATVICTLQGHNRGVTDFVWSISNDTILSCSLDGTARLWSVAKGQCIREIQDPSGAEVYRCLFQPINNNLFVIGNGKAMVQVMNLSTGKVVKGGTSKVMGKVIALCFDTSGHVLWTGDDRGSVFSFLFDLASGKINKAKKLTIAEGHPVTSICHRTWISREARDPSLLVNCGLHALCLYKIKSEDGGIELKKKFAIKQRTQCVRSSFCPLMSFRQGACVVSGSEDSTIYFFDVERDTKPCVNKLQGHSGAVLDVCFNYDESMLASCDSYGTVIVWKREQKS